MLAIESVFEFSPTQRRSVGWRLDGGFGSDDNLGWLLARGYQVMAKGASHRRAEKLAQQVRRWDQFDETSWLAWSPSPVEWGRPVYTLGMRIK